MKTLMISPSWLFTLLVAHTVIGFGVGWFVCILRRRSLRTQRRQQGVADQTGEQLSDPQSLLEEMEATLAGHATALALFEQGLKSDTDDLHVTDSVAAARIDAMRQANRNLAGKLDHTTAELARVESAYRDLLQRELERVSTYGRQTQEFDQAIAALDVEQPLHQLAEAVFKTIHDLSDANCHLQGELKECQRKLAEEAQRAIAAESDARIDVLTQLPNRRSFDERLAELQSLQQRYAQPYALILFDIDRFKRINDNYGHAAGDAILAMIGRVLTDCRRAADHVSRFGGEEFALLAAQCSEDQAKVIAERYRKRIALASLRYGTERLQITVSAGVARVDSESMHENVLERADHALYLAKDNGCNCSRVFDDTQQMPLTTIG